jgi:AbrB family looped-hinge helix DNA binding protein
MGITVIEERGRVLIPKQLREKLHFRNGEKVRVEAQDGTIVIRPLKGLDELKQLRGCISRSVMSPLDVKHMWVK